MSKCEMCGSEVETGKKYCLVCEDYMRQAYEQMEDQKELMLREDYEEEMRRDAFGY